MRRQRETEFGDYVAARAAGLVRFAYLICGDWHRAEDAVQTALTKLYLAWTRLDPVVGIDAYTRRSGAATRGARAAVLGGPVGRTDRRGARLHDGHRQEPTARGLATLREVLGSRLTVLSGKADHA